AYHEPQGVLDLDRDSGRRCELNRMGIAELQHELLAIHLRAIARSYDLEHLAESGGYAGHHVLNEGTHGAEGGVTGQLLRRNLGLAIRYLHVGSLEDGHLELTLGALDMHALVSHLDRHAIGNHNRALTDSRHVRPLPNLTHEFATE